MAIKPLQRFIALSAAGHILAFVLAGVIAGFTVSKRPDRNVIVTKLVRLGKQRPKELLPRKQKPAAASKTPPPKVAEKKKIKVPSPTANPTATAAPAASLKNVLKNLKEEIEPEGHEQGSIHGTTSKLTEALALNRFVSEIHACVQSKYALEGLSRSRVEGRKVEVFVRVGDDGVFSDEKVEKSSGLAAMDRAVERAVRRCGKVSPPPKSIREDIQDGVIFDFSP